MVGDTGEEPELDEFRAGGVGSGEFFERFMDEEEGVFVAFGRDIDFVEIHPGPIASVLEAGFLAGAFDENSAHRFCGGGEEMMTILPALIFLSEQTEVGFVDEGGRLEGVIGRLIGHPPGSEFTKFAIDGGQ